MSDHNGKPSEAALYRRLLGPRFKLLPPEIRVLRDVQDERMASGQCSVTRGSHPFAQRFADKVGLPKDGLDVRISARFVTEGPREIWHRCFGDVPMMTVHQEGTGSARGLLIEHVGNLTFGFQIRADENGLHRNMTRVWLRGIAIPKPPGLSITGAETVRNGRFCFEVAMTVPVIGRLVHYVGWLEPDISPVAAST